jgi:hypothetical protein
MKLHISNSAIILVFSLFLVSCGGSNYMALSTAKVQATPEMATIVFYRSTKFGGGIKSAIFDVTNPQKTEFFGSLFSRSKIAVQVPPGDYTFMVMGENADFAYASVEAGHIYYIAVMVRMGFGKARFSLNPVSKKEFSDPSFSKVDVCKLYEKTPEADAWYTKHKADVEARRAKYYEKWMSKPESDRPHLLATDYQ